MIDPCFKGVNICREKQRLRKRDKAEKLICEINGNKCKEPGIFLDKRPKKYRCGNVYKKRMKEKLFDFEA